MSYREKTGSYIRHAEKRRKSEYIEVSRIEPTLSDHNSALEPTGLKPTWSDLLFSEELSYSTDDWTTSEILELSESEESTTYDQPHYLVPEPPKYGLRRLVSVSRCKVGLRKHQPDKIYHGVQLEKGQRTMGRDFVLWLDWKRYKRLNDKSLHRLWVKFIKDLHPNQKQVLLSNFYQYEYERLRRKNVLEFLRAITW